MNFIIGRIMQQGLELGLSRRAVARLTAFKFLVIVFEALSLASLIPVIEFLSSASKGLSAVPSTGWIRESSDYLGIEPDLATLAVVTFSLITIRQILQYRYQVALAAAREGFLAKIRADLVQQFLSARLEAQENSLKGEIVNGLTVEAERAASGTLEIVAFIGSIVLLISYMIGLLALSPEMMIAVTGVLLACLFPMRHILRLTATNNRALVGDNATAMSVLVNRLRSARLVRLAGMVNVEGRDYARLVGQIADRRTINARLSARIPLVVEPLSIGGGLLCIVLAIEVFHTSVPVILIFLAALLRTLPVFRECLSLAQKFASMEHSIAAIRTESARLREAKEADPGTAQMPILEKGIAVEQVSYTYPGASEPALIDVSLTLPARCITVILGPSGSGKSTLIDLLPALRQPSEGRILFDDRDIRSIDCKSLRNAIAYAQQSPIRLNHSVRELLSYGSANLPEQQLWDTLKVVGLLEVIRSRPDGLDTVLTDEATGFSGGQLQRLEIARALAQTPQIVILDEPTSNLDKASERDVIGVIRRLRDDLGLTVIVVTHRLEVLDVSDQIVAMRHGKVFPYNYVPSAEKDQRSAVSRT